MKILDQSLLFATAFYHVSGKAPNAWTVSEPSKIQMYYKCMIVCYASLRRLYPEAQLVLFTNRNLPAPFNGQLETLRVKTAICDSRYVDDPAFKNNFPGCLFTLDVIEHLAHARSNDFQYLVLTDSDSIVRDRLDTLVNEPEGHEEVIYAYELGYPVSAVVNGHSRASLALARSYFSGQLAVPPIAAYGGEFYFIPTGALPKLAKRIEAFWSWMKSEGTITFSDNLTEEHVMSVILAEIGANIYNADRLIKRIWTTPNYSNVDGQESNIPIWHLPAEKKRGFAELYRHWLVNKGFDSLDDAAFRSLVDKAIPLHKRGHEYPGQSHLLRLRNAVKLLVRGYI